MTQVQTPTQAGPAYRIDYTFGGKTMVHYKCPKCGGFHKRKLGEAGRIEICDACGHQHTVPGVVEKEARARKIIEESLAADAAREAAKAVRRKRVNPIAVVAGWLVQRMSALFLLGCMCVGIGILAAGFFVAFWVTSERLETARAANLRVLSQRRIVSEESMDLFRQLTADQVTFLRIGCYLTGFFATLLIGYAIASAIERSAKRSATPQP